MRAIVGGLLLALMTGCASADPFPDLEEKVNRTLDPTQRAQDYLMALEGAKKAEADTRAK